MPKMHPLKGEKMSELDDFLKDSDDMSWLDSLTIELPEIDADLFKIDLDDLDFSFDLDLDLPNL